MNKNFSPHRFSNVFFSLYIIIINKYLRIVFYFQKSKEAISNEPSRIGLVKLKGKNNNNYQFEDLSQFVIQKDQQIVKLNSILKNSLSSDNLKENNKNVCNETGTRRKYKHSKSVQINNEDSIYGNIFFIYY